MNLGALEKFAKEARVSLMRMVGDKIERALLSESPARRENRRAVEELERVIKVRGQESVVEEAAYTWFNRFCAFRFMDANRYTSIGVVSPLEDSTQPEILAEARNGIFDERIRDTSVQEEVRSILSGALPSTDPLGDAYRKLFIATCEAWRPTFPFLFKDRSAWTEILLPDDLLSENSILAKVRAAMTQEDCESGVEIIGWLYQFYIAEKKDAIFESLKKNVKISAENIPAATQLFTPDWIVKYLVQNSLGRLWLRLHPESSIRNRMEYYVPEDPECSALPVPDGIVTPEDLRLCDPCTGSAHMLVCLFDLLYEIYEETGYESKDIPRLILTKNLYGMELDPRAANLASFALMMKARAKYRRFFTSENVVQPNICCFTNVVFAGGEIAEYRSHVEDDLFTVPMVATLTQFADAENLGSLIVPELQNADEALCALRDEITGDLLFRSVYEKIVRVVVQAGYLSRKYHVVVTNPPYMGGKGMNTALKAFAEANYPNSKSDLFAMFIERCCALAVPNGFVSMVTMQSWMFLSSFEKLRAWLFENTTMTNLCHMGNMVMRIAFGTSSTTWQNTVNDRYRAGCCYVDYDDCDDNGVPLSFPPDNERNRKAGAS